MAQALVASKTRLSFYTLSIFALPIVVAFLFGCQDSSSGSAAPLTPIPASTSGQLRTKALVQGPVFSADDSKQLGAKIQLISKKMPPTEILMDQANLGLLDSRTDMSESDKQDKRKSLTDEITKDKADLDDDGKKLEAKIETACAAIPGNPTGTKMGDGGPGSRVSGESTQTIGQVPLGATGTCPIAYKQDINFDATVTEKADNLMGLKGDVSVKADWSTQDADMIQITGVRMYNYNMSGSGAMRAVQGTDFGGGETAFYLNGSGEGNMILDEKKLNMKVEIEMVSHSGDAQVDLYAEVHHPDTNFTIGMFTKSGRSEIFINGRPSTSDDLNKLLANFSSKKPQGTGSGTQTMMADKVIMGQLNQMVQGMKNSVIRL